MSWEGLPYTKGEISFLRVSGDEPGPFKGCQPDERFSPRERG